MDIIPGELSIPRCQICIKVRPKGVKITEALNKVFWCWDVSEGEYDSLQGTFISLPITANDSIQDMENEATTLALDILSPRSRFTRYHHVDVSKYSSIELRLDWDTYLNEERKDLVKRTELYDRIFDVLSNLKSNISIHIKREPSIMKSIKDESLFPIVWYYEGAYNIQTERNYTSNPSMYGRGFEMLGDGYRRTLKDGIEWSVRYENFDNWSSVSIDSKYITKVAPTIAGRRY